MILFYFLKNVVFYLKLNVCCFLQLCFGFLLWIRIIGGFAVRRFPAETVLLQHIFRNKGFLPKNCCIITHFLTQLYLTLPFQSIQDDRNFRLDKRLTGSSVIDDALQELLQYIIRDYIENWYGKISSDVEFLYEARQNLQNLTINISNRYYHQYNCALHVMNML